MYLFEVSIILAVLVFIHPFLWHIIALFISHFHFAQKTLRGEALGTNSCLEKAFTGLFNERNIGGTLIYNGSDNVGCNYYTR